MSTSVSLNMMAVAPDHREDQRASHELSAASCAVALAPFDEWCRQSKRIAVLAAEGVITKVVAVDRLRQIAVAYDIEFLIGAERVQEIMVRAFANIGSVRRCA